MGRKGAALGEKVEWLTLNERKLPVKCIIIELTELTPESLAIYLKNKNNLKIIANPKI